MKSHKTKPKRWNPAARLFTDEGIPLPVALGNPDSAEHKARFLSLLADIERETRPMERATGRTVEQMELATEVLRLVAELRHGATRWLPQTWETWQVLSLAVGLGISFDQLSSSIAFVAPVAAARASELRGQQNRTKANNVRQQQADAALLDRFRAWQDKTRMQLERLGAVAADERVRRFKRSKRPLPDRDSRRLTRLLKTGKIPPL